jgi:hypothetical protein
LVTYDARVPVLGPGTRSFAALRMTRFAQEDPTWQFRNYEPLCIVNIL